MFCVGGDAHDAVFVYSCAALTGKARSSRRNTRIPLRRHSNSTVLPGTFPNSHRRRDLTSLAAGEAAAGTASGEGPAGSIRPAEEEGTVPGEDRTPRFIVLVQSPMSIANPNPSIAPEPARDRGDSLFGRNIAGNATVA